MSLKILASLIILIAVVAHATKRQQRIAENREKEKKDNWVNLFRLYLKWNGL